jgi:multidrug resistance efflux pump
MLSEKQFRERARSELREIRNQVLSLARDRDVYWKVEREIIAPNPQLHGVRNGFLDMVRAAYADAMAARVLRLLDAEDVDLSLQRILTQLEDYPHLLHDKVSEREFADDRAELDRAAANLKRVLNPHFAHHERTLSALASTHRELDEAIDMIISTLKTYYWIIAEAHLDFEVSYPEDPLAIFQFAWIKPDLVS